MIAVVGAGKWGSALAQAFAIAGHEVALCPARERAGSFNNQPFLKPHELASATHIVFALSSKATASFLAEHFLPRADYSTATDLIFSSNSRLQTAEQLVAKAQNDSQQQRAKISANAKVLIATKGLYHGALMSEVYAPYFSQIAILSGPSFAAEVAKQLPTAVVISSAELALAEEFAALFPPFVKPYASTDMLGAQIAGAYKNVIAIASGICDALELGNNARAALLSRGLVEISRFSEHFGAKASTILGLAGAGDLFLTASSNLSRNYRAGALLAAGNSPDAIAQELGEVVEGFAAAEEITNLAATRGIHAPIAAQVRAICGGKDIKAAIADLLKR